MKIESDETAASPHRYLVSMIVTQAFEIKEKTKRPDVAEDTPDWIRALESYLVRGNPFEDAHLSYLPPIAYLVLASWRRASTSCSATFFGKICPRFSAILSTVNTSPVTLITNQSNSFNDKK